jgi:hypothetical protein
VRLVVVSFLAGVVVVISVVVVLPATVTAVCWMAVVAESVVVRVMVVVVFIGARLISGHAGITTQTKPAAMMATTAAAAIQSATLRPRLTVER